MDRMPPLPGGTVTFVFTDIEGSTRLLQQLGDDYADVADAHRRIVREAFTARGGTEVTPRRRLLLLLPAGPRRGGRGGRRPAHPRRASLARRLCPEGADGRAHWRAGRGGGRLHGLDVHRAARICASGHGGQVLLSDATKALVGTAMPDGVQVQDLGEHALKDIDGREHLWGLAVDGLPGSFPPPRTSAGPNPLENREKQIEARIEQYVLDSIEQAFRPKSEASPKARGLGGLAAVGLATLGGLVLILILLVLFGEVALLLTALEPAGSAPADGVKPPLARDAWGSSAAVVERDARACDEIAAPSATREPRWPRRWRRHARRCARRFRPPCRRPSRTLPCGPGADGDVDLPHVLADGPRAADRSRRPVEGGEEAVARCIDLLTRKRASRARTRRWCSVTSSAHARSPSCRPAWSTPRCR